MIAPSLHLRSTHAHRAEADAISHDFDFLHGRWHVHNRRMLRPLSGQCEWVEFAGSSVVRPVWEGRACFEEWEGDTPGGHVSAVSLHLYDPRAKQWRLHWATRADGRIGVPTIGGFAHGRGVFYAQEEYDGASIFLRIVWEPRGASACRFEQAFSNDGGATWETNWIMDFTRAADEEPLTSRAAQRAIGGMRDFDFLHGLWNVHNRRLTAILEGATYWYEYDGTSHEHPFWNGDGNLEEYTAVLPSGAMLRGVALRLYEPDRRRWTINWANGANGTLDTPMIGTFRDAIGTFYSQELLDGRPIFVRFFWVDAGDGTAHWEQSYSADGGHSWEMNWIMDFSRTGS
jgi:hypothetical protein